MMTESTTKLPNLKCKTPTFTLTVESSYFEIQSVRKDTQISSVVDSGPNLDILVPSILILHNVLKI